MRYNRFFHTLALAVILALLMIAIPVTPALAAVSISVTPSSGTIGDYVEIECTGFSTSDVDLYFYFSSESASVNDEIDTDVINYERVAIVYADDIDASFTTDFDVPERLTDGDETEDVSSGTYYVYAAFEDDDVIVARDTFTVTVTELTISPTSGVVGTEVKIEGSGFDDNKSITIEYDGADVDIASGDEETDSRGEFSCTITIPESFKGDHTITVTVSGDEAKVKFTVKPKMTMSPEKGSIGDTVKVSGTGFAKSKAVTITFDEGEVATDETDSYGSFEISFKVPEVAAGTHDVKVKDAAGNTASAKFTITTNVSISPTTSQASPGYVGMELTISGSGFKPNSEITITYASEPVKFTTTSGADGSFSYKFKVPPSAAGTHTITASDGTSSMQVTFIMESTPPKTPSPLLPYMGDKLKEKFDWEDVTKDVNGADEKSTPVTYDLQIATDKEFKNILLEKKGLTTSEYTLTEAEKLESTKKEAPYYWRERAVDAASNASEWTGAGEFYVGFAFGFPGLKGWVLYALIGVGAILVFFIGLLVGRRRGGAEY